MPGPLHSHRYRGEIMRALVSLIIPGHRQPNIKLEQPHFDATRNALGQR
ncbi:hypothetical protein [Nitrosospira multiformis]|nr:hypothetical protein [Nitrosospira multiformis]